MIKHRRATLSAALAGCLLTLFVAGCTGKPARPVAAPVPAPAGSSSQPGSASPSPSSSASASPSTTSASPTPKKSTAKPSPLKPGTGTHGPVGSQSLTGSNAVALTFDDGPDPVLTPQVLDLLKQYHVHATFCLIGSRARDYPDLVRRIVAEGHTLCNHSWQHLEDLGKRDFSYQNWDLRSTNDAIHAAVPGAQIKYFRAPGGNFTTGLVQLARDLGMSSLYWDVDPRDWDNATFGHGTTMVNHIVTVVEQTVRPGSIILSHDRAHPDTPVAYQTLLPWLLARYQLIPLP